MVAGLQAIAGQGGMHAMAGRQGPLGRMGAFVLSSGLEVPFPTTSRPGRQRQATRLCGLYETSRQHKCPLSRGHGSSGR